MVKHFQPRSLLTQTNTSLNIDEGNIGADGIHLATRQQSRSLLEGSSEGCERLVFFAQTNVV